MALLHSSVISLLLASAALGAYQPAPQIQPALPPQASPLYAQEQEQNAGPGVRVTYNVDVDALLEQLRGIIRTGNETLGVPVLDPFTEAGPVGGNFSYNGLELQGEVSNVVATGLADVDGTLKVATQGFIVITGLEATLDATVPKVVASADATFSVTNTQTGETLSGSGPTTITVTNVGATVTASVGVLSLDLKEVTISLSVGNIDVVIQDNPELSQQVTQLANAQFAAQKSSIEEDLVNLLKPVLENALDNYDIIDLLCEVVHIPLLCTDIAKRVP